MSVFWQLLETTHREDFVPVRYRKMAFTDMAIPLDHGQSMMKPVVEGRLLQALELKPDETVLEIGHGQRIYNGVPGPDGQTCHQCGHI